MSEKTDEKWEVVKEQEYIESTNWTPFRHRGEDPEFGERVLLLSRLSDWARGIDDVFIGTLEKVNDAGRTFHTRDGERVTNCVAWQPLPPTLAEWLNRG